MTIRCKTSSTLLESVISYDNDNEVMLYSEMFNDFLKHFPQYQHLIKTEHMQKIKRTKHKFANRQALYIFWDDFADFCEFENMRSDFWNDKR